MIGYFIQDTWEVSDKFVLTPGLRYDTYDLQPLNGANIKELTNESLTPKLTATYSITKGDKVTASFYQAARTPGLPEMYWWANGMTAGNPTLEPEKNNAGELIYQHKFSQKALLRISTYYYDINDFIMFRNDPNWRGVYNIDNVKLYGASIEQRMALTPRMSARTSLTYQMSKKNGDTFDTAHLTDQLDFLPQWKASVGAEFKLPYNSTLNADFHFSGDRTGIYAYTNSAGVNKKLVTVDSSLTCDLDLKIPVTKHGQVDIFVKNLFNVAYEEVYGYPLPGIMIGTGFKWSF